MKKYGLSVLSGLFIAFSFPTILFGWQSPNFGFLAWGGLVPLLFILYESSPKESFRLGFLSAFVSFLISFYWIVTALNTFGNISPVWSILTMTLLAFVMALYIGAAIFLAKWFQQKNNGELLILLPVFWTLFEWVRNYTPFGGFPWSNLAMSQASYHPLIQIADITGAYGIIFLIVWLNVWLTEVLLKWQGKNIRFLKQKSFVTIAMIFLVLGYGFYRIHQVKKQMAQGPHLKVGLIQPNISQEEKWDEAKWLKHQMIFGQAVQSLQHHVDLIVWPEASWTQNLFVGKEKIAPEDVGISFSKDFRPYTLLGLNFFAFQEQRQRFYNSAALLDAHGNILGKYHKVHLVPFGEYVPLKKLFFFLKPVAAMGDYEAGQEIAPLGLENISVGPLICYEDIFPGLSRTFVKRGANLLVNMTNDAWYGVSSAPFQHLALAALRSTETKRAMVRATNTGVSAVISPTGNVIVQSPIFEQSVLVHQVPLLSKQTLYTRLGDWFIGACLLYMLWQLLKLKSKK